MIFDRWLKTRQDWIFAVLVVLSFAVLGLLVVFGYGFALDILVLLIGWLAGMLLAYLISSPFGESFARRFGSWKGYVASAVGLISMFAIIFLLGPYLLGIPAIPSEDYGAPGAFVFGFALGFGSKLRRVLSPPPPTTLEEDQESARASLRLMLVIGGAVAGLFALAFTAFVLFEYVAAPLIRYVAE
jgi:hypothetical protein